MQCKPVPLPTVIAAQSTAARSFEMWLEACRKHEAARTTRPAGVLAGQGSGNVGAATAAADMRAKDAQMAASGLKRAHLCFLHLPGCNTLIYLNRYCI